MDKGSILFFNENECALHLFKGSSSIQQRKDLNDTGSYEVENCVKTAFISYFNVSSYLDVHVMVCINCDYRMGKLVNERLYLQSLC